MIQHNKPTIDDKDKTSLSEVLDTGWLAGGANVAAFEAEFAELYGLPGEHAVAVSSGSAALFLALQAMNVKRKKVAIPVFSCSSLENAVHLSQGEAVYVDTRKESFNMEQASLDNADIIVHPHMFGYPSEINESLRGRVIEDCAQSIGSRVNGQLVGLQGELGVFSFYATKLLTSAGQGGMVVSRNTDYISFIRDYIDFDQKNDGKSRFNLSMTDIQAAMGRNQLARLFESFIPRREEIYRSYCDAGVNLYDTPEVGVEPVRYRALLRVGSPSLVIKYLYKKGIRAIIPISEAEILGGSPHSFVNAKLHSSSWVSIPCYPSLNNTEIEEIIDALKKMKVT